MFFYKKYSTKNTLALGNTFFWLILRLQRANLGKVVVCLETPKSGFITQVNKRFYDATVS